MSFLRQIFLNEPSDCDWLRSTALKASECPPFLSFVLSGNEDSPAMVELYRNQGPAYNEQPIATYAMNDESGILEKKHEPKSRRSVSGN